MNAPRATSPAVLLISPGIVRWTDLDFGLPHLVALGGYLRHHTGVRVEILDLNLEGGDLGASRGAFKTSGPCFLWVSPPTPASMCCGYGRWRGLWQRWCRACRWSQAATMRVRFPKTSWDLVDRLMPWCGAKANAPCVRWWSVCSVVVSWVIRCFQETWSRPWMSCRPTRGTCSTTTGRVRER